MSGIEEADRFDAEDGSEDKDQSSYQNIAGVVVGLTKERTSAQGIYSPGHQEKLGQAAFAKSTSWGYEVIVSFT